jgi:small subunit ribosomal protein S18b
VNQNHDKEVLLAEGLVPVYQTSSPGLLPGVVQPVMSGHHVVVIGAGIAGMSFTETFSSLCPDVRVSVLSASPELKVAHVSSSAGRLMQSFDVKHLDVREVSSSSLIDSNSNVTLFREKVVSLDAGKHQLLTSTGKCIDYSFAVICTGARPVPIPGSRSHVLCIRDTQSVSELQLRLSNSRKVVVVGNGGIATELVFKMSNTDIVWVIRDKSISSVFFDPVSAQFMIDSLNERKADNNTHETPAGSRKFIVNGDSVNVSGEEPGSALGPDWCFGRQFTGRSREGTLVIEYETEVTHVRETSESSSGDTVAEGEEKEDGERKEKHDYPVVVELSNGKNIPCDIVISATGEWMRHALYECQTSILFFSSSSCLVRCFSKL